MVYETVSHTATIAGTAMAIRPDSRRANTGNARTSARGGSSGAGACQQLQPAFHVSFSRVAAMAAAGDLRCRPLGKLSRQRHRDGFAQFQNNPVPGDDNAQATLSNGQIFIQKRTGSFSTTSRLASTPCRRFQCRFFDAQHTVNNFYGPFRSST